MKNEILNAINTLNRYNKMSLEDCVIEYEYETRQSIPQEAIDEFKFTGLNNTDMFASNFLTRYNLKNIYDK